MIPWIFLGVAMVAIVVLVILEARSWSRQ